MLFEAINHYFFFFQKKERKIKHEYHGLWLSYRWNVWLVSAVQYYFLYVILYLVSILQEGMDMGHHLLVYQAEKS